MKKVLMILFALTLVFSLAACGGKDAPAEQPANEQPAIEEQPAEEQPASEVDFSSLASGEYAALMSTGKYYMESTIFVMGFETASKQAVDGDTNDAIVDVMGMTTHTLTMGNTIYTIDDEAQTYTVTEVDPATVEASVPEVDYTDLAYVGTGNGAVPGFEDVDAAAYDYDEYQVVMGEDEGDMTVTMRYYLKDGQLYVIYIDIEGMSTIMQVNVLTTDIPAGMLELPAGYTEVSAS